VTLRDRARANSTAAMIIHVMTWYDDAMRTIIELPGEQIEALDALCRRDRISRAEAVRRAVALLVRSEGGMASGAAFGVWRDRREDGLAYQRRIRSEWQTAPAPRTRR
jgi:hypothetical protein